VRSVNGLGLSWTQVEAQCGGRGQTGVEVWKAQGVPVSDGAVTATLAQVPDNAVIAVSRYAGTTGIGAIVSANTLGDGGLCAGGTDSAVYAVDLTTTVDSAVVWSAVALRNHPHAPGAGYIERAEHTHGREGERAGVAVQDTVIQSVSTVSVNGTLGRGSDWAVVAVEIMP